MRHDYDLNPNTPTAQAAQADYVVRSDLAATMSGAELDIAYGSHDRQRLDVFKAVATPAPAILFFHGGYWTAGSKDSRRFPAVPWIDCGVTWVPVQYRLTPSAELFELVDDARSAVSHIVRHAKIYGVDPDRIHVAGNSAGAHLSAMIAASDWTDSGIDRSVIASLTAVSGLFDLVPLLDESAQDWLHMTSATARALSPMNARVPEDVDTLIAWGGNETPVFKHQSKLYAECCKNWGVNFKMLECAAQDHFSIIAEFGNPNSELFRAMRVMIVGQ